MSGLVTATYRWLEPAPVSPAATAALRASLNLPSEVCEFLVRRGYGSPIDARSFLRPRLADQHLPDRLPDIGPAVERIEAAIRGRESLLVHGDYDADGMCAAALLTRGLRVLGARATAFVPHRLADGYDLGAAGLDRAEAVGATLIVTADCGTSAHGTVRAAAERGIDVIITDHHRPAPTLPSAVAVVNPNRTDSAYPFGGLAGVGVAFKLLAVLFGRAGVAEERLNQHLDLVALGTVADLAPLRGENRVLVRAGLRAIARSRKPGIRALLRLARLEEEEALSEEHLGFILGPRLNSVGRIATAADGLRLLITDDAAEAERLATYLEDRNAHRRTVDRRVLEAAERQLEETFRPERDAAVVLWDEKWHPGVIGIAASRLVDRLHRPVVLVALDAEVGRGSGRSVAPFHLHRALAECEDLLLRFGGHRLAAGFEIRREKLEAFRARFEALAAGALGQGERVRELAIDVVLPLERVEVGFAPYLRYLGPFGVGNPEPLIEVRRVVFHRLEAVGDGSHLKATMVAPEGGRVPAIGFGMASRRPELDADRLFDVAFALVEDRWRGRSRAVARLVDFRPSDPQPTG